MGFLVHGPARDFVQTPVILNAGRPLFQARFRFLRPYFSFLIPAELEIAIEVTEEERKLG